MSVNFKAAINRAFQEVRTDVFQAMDAVEKYWPLFATEVPSRSRSTMHAWIANQASVREWVGPRIARNMGTRTWEVANKKYELTFEFERDQIEDDLEGLGESAVMQASQLGSKFAKHEDLLIAATLEAGITAECWDGQLFFDTDHPVDVDGIGSSATFDNDRTLALTHANFRTVRTAMLANKQEDGSPLVLPGGLTLLVPPQLELEAKQICEVASLTPAAAYGLYGTGGVSQNPMVGTAKVVMNPYLTQDTRWYLLATGEFIKPLMLQRRRPLEIAETDESSDLWFNEEKFQVGGSARYTASYTLPQLAFTSKP
jgi:phage major head subunit gpT-like protein